MKTLIFRDEESWMAGNGSFRGVNFVYLSKFYIRSSSKRYISWYILSRRRL